MKSKNLKFWILILGLHLIFINQILSQNKVKIDYNTFGALNARHIGPAGMSGRVSALDAVDTDPRIIYIGSASGGLWKTKNGGTTFKPIFDEYTQSIGAVKIDQKNPDTVWVGTGETWVRNSVSIGNGIYKTTDGGENWKFLGLKETERIARIAIDKNNSDVVYVAALGHLWGPNKERGLYKTSDGGKTWENILYVDENTGCTDIAIDTENPNILYAAMWEFQRKAYTFNSGGKGSALYKSIDAGKTWEKLTKDLPTGILGRIAISVSSVNPNIVYALIESEKTALYRSKDKGISWEEMNKTRAVSERPFYFSNIFADPIDTNRVYKPGFGITVSDNGGKNFSGTSIEGGNFHSDLHAMYIGKKDNNLIYIGTDGGLYISADKGNTWRIARNLPLSQFYHVSADMQSPYNVYGGLQDNGSWYGPSKSPGGITNYDWKSIGFGDGFCVYSDPKDNNIIFWQYQGGEIARAYAKTNEFKSIKPYKTAEIEDLRFNWNTPVIFSRDGERMYVGSQYLYVTENKGDSWKRISPDLTTDNPQKQMQEKSGGLTIDNSTAENHCTIITINESPLDKNIIWVGTDDGNIQVTKDGGKTWANVIQNISELPVNTWCSYIEPSNFDKSTAYATFDGHYNNDMNPYIYKTTDFGKTWISLSDNNLNTNNHIIKQDFINKNLLFLGTEFGLYVSINDGKLWSKFKGNVPNVSIRDMVIHPRENDLILATHGRGILIIDDISPLRNLKEETLNSDLTFLKSNDYIINDLGMTQNFEGDDEFRGQNPPEAATITYYMKKRHIFGEMYIEIFDKDGNNIKKLPAGNRKGINKVVWRLRKKPPKVPASPQLAGFAMQGPLYPAGEYTVKLTKGEDVYESKINIKLNPNSPHSESDRIFRAKVVNQAYDLLEKLAFIDAQITDIRDKSKTEAKTASKSLSKKLNTLYDKMETLHKELVATKEGDITGEEKLREKISQLYGYIMFYKGKPTDSQVQRLKDLEKIIEQKNNYLNDLINNDLAKINKSLLNEKKSEIKIISKEDYFKED
ncbi:MAG: hypothetical protein JXR51_13060 [Bacteroidales bacterium]|nr:hypothetical protein [Bacteroidales bacterium]MBN2758100.1 hypothetical protein [Bacteroidales bacterium]